MLLDHFWFVLSTLKHLDFGAVHGRTIFSIKPHNFLRVETDLRFDYFEDFPYMLVFTNKVNRTFCRL